MAVNKMGSDSDDSDNLFTKVVALCPFGVSLRYVTFVSDGVRCPNELYFVRAGSEAKP